MAEVLFSTALVFWYLTLLITFCLPGPCKTYTVDWLAAPPTPTLS